jgi:lysophospholipase L1-like esterase
MKRWWILSAAFFLSAAAAASSQSLAIHDGDRVAFYGDSITAQRLYTRFAEEIVLTRYPQMHVSFVNAGVPGDTAHGGYTGDIPTRLKRDLLPSKPAVVTIMLGMNDGYYMPFNQEYLDMYKRDYRALVTAIQSDLPGARITLISPTPYDEVTHGTGFPHYNEVVARHAVYDRELASSMHLGFCNLFDPISSLVRTAEQSDPSLASLLVPDRIHPSEAAHWAMAVALARAWGVSPIVSSTRIDAHNAKVLVSDNTSIEGLAATSNGLQWTQIDRALPLPLPLDNPMMQFVLRVSDLAAMDQQILRVDGLTAPRYALSIDKWEVGTFTREELAKGVNLAVFATPMQSQAGGVEDIGRKRAQLDDAHFVLYLDDAKSPADPEAAKVLSAKDAALAEQERAAAQPKSHEFVLVAK